MVTDASEPRRRFTRTQRLKDQLVFLRATRRGEKVNRGPLMFHALPAATPVGRLGIRISRRCGNAPTRNRIKRLLRESYRLSQHDWPRALDVVVTVKPHAPLPLGEYRRLLGEALGRLCQRIVDGSGATG